MQQNQLDRVMDLNMMNSNCLKEASTSGSGWVLDTLRQRLVVDRGTGSHREQQVQPGLLPDDVWQVVVQFLTVKSAYRLMLTLNSNICEIVIDYCARNVPFVYQIINAGDLRGLQRVVFNKQWKRNLNGCLIQACKHKSIEMVRLLLSDDRVDVNELVTATRIQYWVPSVIEGPPLQIALHNQSFSIVQLLLKHPNIKNVPYKEIAHAACLNLQHVKDLFSEMRPDHVFDPTMLISISSNYNIQVLQYISSRIATERSIVDLIDESCDDNVLVGIKEMIKKETFSTDYPSLLLDAITKKDARLVRLLLVIPQYTDLSKICKRLVSRLVLVGAYDIVQYILLNHPEVDPSEDDSHALSVAWDVPDAKLYVHALLQDGRVCPTITDFERAILKQFTKSIPLFLSDQRLDVASNSERLLAAALETENPLSVKQLLTSPHVQPNSEAVYYAFRIQHDELSNVIFRKEAFEPKLEFVRRALQVYTENIVLQLMSHSKFQMQNSQSTLLELACSRNFVSVVQHIFSDSSLTFKSDVTAKCVVSALQKKHSDLFEALLADSRTSLSGALTYACQIGNYELVVRLLNDSRVDPRENANEPFKQAKRERFIRPKVFEVMKEYSN